MTKLRNWQICGRPYSDGGVNPVPSYDWDAMTIGQVYQPDEQDQFHVEYSEYEDRNWKGTGVIRAVRKDAEGLHVSFRDGGVCFLDFADQKK